MAAEQVQGPVAYYTQQDRAESSQRGSPQATDQVQSRIEILFATLDKRGTGEHQCSYCKACQKGAATDGFVQTYHRNSSFK